MLAESTRGFSATPYSHRRVLSLRILGSVFANLVFSCCHDTELLMPDG